MTGAPNFDPLAKPYRWLEYLSFGPFLQRTRTDFLPRLAGCKTALVLGDGDGRFTARLLHENRAVHVHAVDASQAMLTALQATADADAARVSIEVADLRNWRPEAVAKFDLVATHFFLDCLTTGEIDALAQRLQAAMEPDALWVISDFHVPDNIFGRWVAGPLVAFLYLAFRLLTGLSLDTLPDHGKALRANGWRLEAQRLHLHGLLLSQIWRPASKPVPTEIHHHGIDGLAGADSDDMSSFSLR